MVPRTLLVPLLGVDAEGAALECALSIAQGFDSHVDAVFMRPDPRDSLMLLGDGLSASVIEQILRSAEVAAAARVETARGRFQAAVRSAGLEVTDQPVPAARASVRWRETVGEADRLIVGASRLSDLTVFARKAADLDPGVYDCLEAALLFSGRPVLLAPPAGGAVGTRVAIAWDGGQEAARAVAGALGFLHQATAIDILTVGAQGETIAPATQLVDYLAWRGLTARVVPIEAGHESAGAAILHQAEARSADLLVMGAYGHSRMREMILGGVTRYVLSHADLTVLMVH